MVLRHYIPAPAGPGRAGWYSRQCHLHNRRCIFASHFVQHLAYQGFVACLKMSCRLSNQYQGAGIFITFCKASCQYLRAALIADAFMKKSNFPWHDVLRG